MDKMLYIAMNGAQQALQAQATISNNLANVSTAGFRANLDAYTNWHVQGPGFNTRVYNQIQMHGSNFMPGSFETTGNDLDAAINGDGWFVVQGKDGTEGYTRAGNFQLGPNGQLLTANGDAVIGNGGPIVLPQSEKIDIGSDGSISSLPVGQAANSLVIIDRLKLVNPDPTQLVKSADGLYRMRSGQPAQVDAGVSVVSGVIEHSNVNAVAELVSLIQNARSFETNVKLMKTAQQLDESSARLLRSN